MKITYKPLIGYKQGAKKIHIHGTSIKVKNKADRESHYQHKHKAEEAFYILEGRAVYEFNGKKHPVKKGDAVFFTPDKLHAKMRILSKELKYVVIRSIEKEDGVCCCGKDKKVKHSKRRLV